MILAGEWRASKPSRGIAGFHISELYSPWATWAEIAILFLQAKRLPETLQTWRNSSLGETWEDQGETVAPEGLLARRESYSAAHLPAGVKLITLGTDVQDDRLESTLWGWGADEEAWRIEHLVMNGDPGQLGRAQCGPTMDALLKRKFATTPARRSALRPVAWTRAGISPNMVYRYCAARKARAVWAIKGAGGQGRLVWRSARAGARKSGSMSG